MTPQLKRLLDEPGNDMIVIPFRHTYRNFWMIPVRTEEYFIFVARSYYNPEHYPPGSCIQ